MWWDRDPTRRRRSEWGRGEVVDEKQGQPGRRRSVGIGGEGTSPIGSSLEKG